jgi:ssDNA-binding Zn-finger/Zn-ribbon topoisomerase 1
MVDKDKNEPNGSKDEDKDYICPFCQKTYSTRSGLWKHISKCSARPDSDENEPDADKSGEGDGIDLFKGVEEDEDDEDGYQCPGCGYVGKKAFEKCPKCGAELEWGED